MQIITPNPKTSGGARWNYLAAWGFALERALGGDLASLSIAPAEESRRRRPRPRSSSRALSSTCRCKTPARARATNTFVQRGIGDVLLAWENEALLAISELGPDAFEIVMPSVSILAEPPVALVDAVVDRQRHARRRRGVSRATCTRRRARTSSRATSSGRATRTVAAKYAEQFPQIRMFTVDDVFGGWREAQTTHFADGGVYDRIFSADASRIGAPMTRAPRRVGLNHGDGRGWVSPSVLPGFGLTLGFAGCSSR